MEISESTLKKETWVWAPVLSTEPFNMLLKWTEAVLQLGFTNVCLIFNGPNAEAACKKFQSKLYNDLVQVEWLSGRASIGACQTFIMHRFLQSKAKYLCRIDPDLQFSVLDITKLLKHLADSKCGVVEAQRDEASVAGRMRVLANFILRYLALKLNIWGDPNSGFYVQKRESTSVLCSIPLSRYPEPRILSYLRETPFTVSSQIVPTIPRRIGKTSIRGVLKSFRVFLEALLELLSCNQCE